MEINDKVRSVVAAQFGRKIDDINLDTDLVNDLNGDSIDIVETLIRIEKMFEIKVPEDELSEHGTKVSNLVDIVNIKLGN